MAKKKVLLIDDEIELLDMVSTLLRKWKENVLLATSSTEAIRLLESDHDIGLVISDFTMPEGNGDVVLNYIEKEHLNVPFYFFSALELEAFKRRVSGVLSKPSEFTEILYLAMRFLEANCARPFTTD